MTKSQVLSMEKDYFTSFRHPGCVLQVLPTLIQIQNSLQLSSCLIYSPVKFSFKSRGKEWLRWGTSCTGQNKVSFGWSPKLGSPVVSCSMAGLWRGQEIPEILQVRFNTWHDPGIPEAGLSSWYPQACRHKTLRRDQHQPIQETPKLCLLTGKASFACSLAQHHLFSLQMPLWGTEKPPNHCYRQLLLSQSHYLGNQWRSMGMPFVHLASEV